MVAVASRPWWRRLLRRRARLEIVLGLYERPRPQTDWVMWRRRGARSFGLYGRQP